MQQPETPVPVASALPDGRLIVADGLLPWHEAAEREEDRYREAVIRRHGRRVIVPRKASASAEEDLATIGIRKGALIRDGYRRRDVRSDGYRQRTSRGRR